MRAKGFVIFISILCFLASIWMLSFSFVTRHIEKKAKIEATDASGIVDEAKEAEILRNKRGEKVWMGFTYKECKEKELGLGLDLKGGMNVMLEISLPDIVVALSNNSADTTFLKSLATARANEKSSTKDFLTLFEEAWNANEPDGRLARIFATYEFREKIKQESSNSDVMKVIRTEAESAVANSFNILSSRIDRFGVASPNIQRLGNSGRIMVELPGVKEPERVRKLLQGTANLEFWETYENSELFQTIQQANEVLKSIQDLEKKKDTTSLAAVEKLVDTTTTSLTNLENLTDSASLASLAVADSAKQLSLDDMPLFKMLMPAFYEDNGQQMLMPGPVIGYADAKDTAEIMRVMQMPQIKSLFPKDFKGIWTIKGSGASEAIYSLIALKVKSRDGKAPLDGGAIIDARRSSEIVRGKPGFGVSMTMNSEGSKTWERLTADNQKRSIAIVLDGFAYSFPTVQNVIKGGSSSITGNFTSNEADDLANVLKSGKMPAPAKIVQEAVVGPSLGQESINSGILSFIIAFVLVLAFMWMYYSQAGTTANIALIANVILLLGAMASFGAVLTLPGIAGIVLTMGMAVDANIIIYERIKEELKAGNSQRVAIKEGYKNALSAIIDGQVTSLITGIVLFVLGTGPVKGFATTLVVGILTSLATSIFISRLVAEWMLDRGKNISYGNKFTINFLENTKINFLGMRKKAYIISVISIVIGLGFIFTRGMSYGIDFSGGRTYVVKFDKPVDGGVVRDAVNVFDNSAEVKQFGPNNQLKITTKYKIEENTEEVDKEVSLAVYNAVKSQFANNVSYEEFASTDTNPYGVISSETVGPTIAHDMKINAIIAVIISLIAIFVYIAMRFSLWEFGFGAVMSLVHDTIIMISIFSIGAGLLPWSMDVDQSFIAAVLTVIGFSVNDTVVIFDRIRENRLLYPKRNWREQINESLNSTLMRTINTSATVLLVLLAIFIFGGEVIRGFSFAMIIGVVTGAYSTVFIAVPFAYELLSKKEKKQAGAKK